MEPIITHTPPTYSSLKGAVFGLSQRYPQLKAFPIGKSLLNRNLFALCIGDMHNATVMAGSFHASEWLTTLLLLRFCEDLLRALTHGRRIGDIDVSRALEKRSVVFIPCVNPDGVEIVLNGTKSAGIYQQAVARLYAEMPPDEVWQANARGIDLNHNFDAGFAQLKRLEQHKGIYGPRHAGYGGSRPHSEAETIALVNFCISCDVKQVYAFHSQGEEIYYRYGERTPAKANLMAHMLAASSGYHLPKATGTAAHGGFKDWFIERFGRPGFTVEIGRGKNPLPIEELEPIYARLLEMLLLTLLL